MKIILCLISFVLMLCMAHADAITLKEVAKSWHRPVCYVTSYGRASGNGTGFLSKTMMPDILLLFTARHMLEGNDSVRVTVRAFDTSGSETPITATLPLVENGQREFFISDTLQDCAWMPVSTRQLQRVTPRGFRVFAMEPRAYLETDSLFAGLPVVICGYPLGMKVEEGLPLIRKGSIAGVDRDSNYVLIDATIVGGFSGGPVMIDKTTELGRTVGGSFVGLSFGYTRFEQTKTVVKGGDTTSITESFQISKAVPAQVLLRSVKLFKGKP